MSATASGEPWSGRLSSALARRAFGLLVLPEKALHSGAGAGEPGTQRVGVVGHERERLQQRAWLSAKRPAAVSAPARAKRSSTRSSAGAVCGQQAQGLCEPVRGARRREPERLPRRPRAGRRPRRGRPRAPSARRGGPRRGRRRPARRERLGAALVRAEAPAAGRGLVDRAAHERVPEAEAPGHVGGADEIELQQLVDCVHHAGLGQSRPRPPPARARTGRPPPPLLPARGVPGRTAARAPRSARRRRRTEPRSPASDVSSCAADAAGAVERPRELLEVEGVAAALLVEDRRVGAVDRVAEQLSSLLGAERAELDAGQRPARCARSSAAESRSGTWRGRTASAMSTGAAGGRRRSAPSSSTDAGSAQWRSSSTSTSGCADGEPLEQRAHGAVAAVALVLERHLTAGRERRQRREDVRELGPDVVVERVEAAPGRSPRTYSSSASTKTENGRSRSSSDAEPERTSCPRASARAASSASSRVLPMPGSPDQLDRRRAAPIELVEERCSSRLELVGAPDEVLGVQGHFLPARINQGRRIANQGAEIRVTALMSARPASGKLDRMTRYLLHHRHEPHECGVVFASFKGHESPLRHRPTLASCRSGGHAIWWTVEAASRDGRARAAALLRRRAHDRQRASARCRSHDRQARAAMSPTTSDDPRARCSREQRRLTCCCSGTRTRTP